MGAKWRWRWNEAHRAWDLMSGALCLGIVIRHRGGSVSAHVWGSKAPIRCGSVATGKRTVEVAAVEAVLLGEEIVQ